MDKKPENQKSINASLGDMQLCFGEEEIEIEGDWQFKLPLKSEDYSVDLVLIRKYLMERIQGNWKS